MEREKASGTPLSNVFKGNGINGATGNRVIEGSQRREDVEQLIADHVSISKDDLFPISITDYIESERRPVWDE